jgi:hypothetical protein
MRELPHFENSRNVEMRAALAPPVGSRLLLDSKPIFLFFGFGRGGRKDVVVMVRARDAVRKGALL